MNIYTKVFIALVVVLPLLWFWYVASAGPIRVATDKNAYDTGGQARVTVKNGSSGPICFSACYPFYLQKNDGANGWKDSVYGDCGSQDQAVNCIASGEEKIFQADLVDGEAGENRLKIPVCDNCAQGNKFEASATVYSNNFEIK